MIVAVEQRFDLAPLDGHTTAPWVVTVTHGLAVSEVFATEDEARAFAASLQDPRA